MKRVILLLSVVTAMGCAHTAKWELVWSDEFDYEGPPDPAKWGYEEGFVRNREMQYYTRSRPENARVQNGTLVIEGRKERFPNPRYSPGSSSWTRNREFAGYTAASLITRGKASWTYGRIEVRAKLPEGKGVWPAIWTLGTNMPTVRWPGCGEIDIMEFVGHDPVHVYGTVHYSRDGQHKSSGGKHRTERPFASFHVYALEWRPDRLDFLFDERQYHTFHLNAAGEGPDNPFRKPHYLLLNLALGGEWGREIDDSILPQKYLVDYVRVYKLR
jgi:beta-glucanase (GH16 family)